MARTIVVRHHDIDSTFSFSKVDRAQLYGRRRRVVLDPAGEPCERAELCDDAQTLVRAGMSAQGYFDAAGRFVPQKELCGLDAEGSPVPVSPSTLGEPQPLEGPVPPETVLDLRLKALYLLDAVELSDALSEALSAGQLFRFRFSYRSDWTEDVGILLRNDEGTWALIGEHAPPAWVELEQVAADDFAEDDDDDLDFDFV